MLCHTSEQVDDAKVQISPSICIRLVNHNIHYVVLLQREIAVLRAVRHPSILPLLADTSMPSAKVRGATDVFLLFPFCNGNPISCLLTS
jgi:hypothetical protein